MFIHGFRLPYADQRLVYRRAATGWAQDTTTANPPHAHRVGDGCGSGRSILPTVPMRLWCMGTALRRRWRRCREKGVEESAAVCNTLHGTDRQTARCFTQGSPWALAVSWGSRYQEETHGRQRRSRVAR